MVTHAKSLQENKLLKTDMLEHNKNFKSHHFKVGQWIAVKIIEKVCLIQTSSQTIEY